jgi:HAD superfamily 5'-nucleotidase-like hydrolase
MILDDAPLQPADTQKTLPQGSGASAEDAAPLPEHLLLLEELGRATPPLEPTRTRRVFVNRNLTLDKIDVIGFDMDYTLALYHQPRIETLSIECTLKKMIEQRGYPAALQALEYDPRFAIRGLVVDHEQGNLLKLDRYGYVGRAYHGTRSLPREERQRLYRDPHARLRKPRWAYIDTLFALPEVVLYARAVDYFDADATFNALTPAARSARYARLWTDIRECIDEAHRDESIKRIIKADMPGFIERDPELPSTLHRFRSAGKRLFLLTNSGFDYTRAVMSYLLDRQLPDYPYWWNYFDVVVVDAKKPVFFTEPLPLIELTPDGAPVAPTKSGGRARSGRSRPNHCRFYQGGNVRALDELLGLRGDRVLYVGDHIYGDMYRAKRASVWRTAMIIQEMEQELLHHGRVEESLQQIEVLERRRNRVDAELRYQQLLLQKLAQLASGTPPATVQAAAGELRRRRDELYAASRATDEEIERLELDIEHVFNPFWGPLFKAGNENSRLGEQVEDYACVYTSRVSNFLSYSPFHYFRSPREHLPHERVY